jgi:squalene-hopene/tetraprenyl-beta-curcumene cyclase
MQVRSCPLPDERSMKRFLFSLAWVGLLVSSVAAAGPDPEAVARSRAKAIEFLKKSQSTDGTWTSPEAVGISGLVTYGLLQAGVPADDPVVAKALDKLASYSQPDGRISAPNGRIPAYETAIAIMTLSAANSSGKYTEVLGKGNKFLRGIQFDESKQVEKSDPRYGGAGYGPNGGRPDLSNTSFFLEALQASGAKSDDPAVQKAIIFVSRCQNLESEFNTSPDAAKVNDGGFFYSVSSSGQGGSPAGKNDQGGLRSYGSMTYSGFKSMLFAGVDQDDQRVKAALEWIKKNYTVKENPGMGTSGLYYYYYLFSKGLSASKIDMLEDDKGEKHDWRKELAEHLIATQKENGSWVNAKTDRWMEGDPNLVTAYVLTAFKYCEEK